MSKNDRKFKSGHFLSYRNISGSPSIILPSSPSCLSRYSSGCCSNAALFRWSPFGLCTSWWAVVRGRWSEPVADSVKGTVNFLTLVAGLCGNVCLVAEKMWGGDETFAWENMGCPHLLSLRVFYIWFFLFRRFPSSQTVWGFTDI